MEEGKIVKQKIEKPRDFIDEVIRIHRKNTEILEIFDKNFELRNLLKNTITRMLSNNLIEDG